MVHRPPPNNPKVAKIAMIFSRDTRTYVNTFHVAGAAPLTAADLVTIADAFGTAWDTDGYKAANNNIQLQSIHVLKLDPADPLVHDKTVFANPTGNLSGTIGPGSETNSVSWRTGLGGRKYRGRFYAVGLQDSDTSEDDRYNSANTTRLAQYASQILGRLSLALFDLVVFHWADNTFTKIATFLVHNIVDNQRRRLPSRGR